MAGMTTITGGGSFSYQNIRDINANFDNCIQLSPSGTQTATLASPDFWRWNGMTKFINRPTTDAFIVQMKSEFTGTATAHNGLDLTVDWKGNGTTSGGVRGVQGVARIAATFTMGAASLIGVYGQIANNGTINSGSGLGAALYGLIEDGGVWTAVDHFAPLWLDSHLTKTVSAGKMSMAYITNNGTTVFSEVFYIFGGAGGSGITALFSFDTASAMVPATPGTYSTADGYIVINVGGSPFRIPYFAGVD
jgi:hypothetical protein